MSTFDRHQFDETLEAYLDGDLSPAEARRLEAFARIDAEAREDLHLARLVQHRLQALPPLVCPPDVTSAVFDYARRAARRGFVERIRSFLSANWATVIRPSMAVGILAAVVVVGTLNTRPIPEPRQTAQTSEEVGKALDEAKWVLAYLSDIGLKAATSIRDDVLEERVVAPVNRALGAAFDDEPHVQ